MFKSFTPDIPFVEPAHQGKWHQPSAILIKPSWTTSDKGAANAIAQTQHNPSSRVESCHFIVDDAQTIRCVPTHHAAVSDPPYFKGAISICCCYNPPEHPTETTLFRTARLTARVCKRYRFPVASIGVEDRRRWYHRGFGYGGGIVFDTVGSFPIEGFLNLVKFELELL